MISRFQKFLQMCFALLVFTMPAVGMTLEEAAGKLGSPEEKEVRQAQDVLWAGGVDSMALLERVIFKGGGKEVDHAKHVRRCIMYGVPTQTPDDVLQTLFDFHRFEQKARQAHLQELLDEPSISSVSLACLHSRCAERKMDDVMLKSIEAAFDRKLRSESGRYGLEDHHQRLLLTQTQAMLVNSGRMRVGPKNSAKIYAKWAEQNPELPTWLDRSGVRREYDRLNQKKAINKALVWFGELKLKEARDEIDDRLEYWCRREIKDWGRIEPSARTGALLLLLAQNRDKAGEVYLQFHKDDPGFAENLGDELRILEVQRLMGAGEVEKALKLAVLKMGGGMEREHGKIWSLLGSLAQEKPAAFTNVLPSFEEEDIKLAESFLQGFLDKARRDDALWWQAVTDFKSLLESSGNSQAWYDVLSKSPSSRDFQVSLYAREGRFEEAMADAEKHGYNGYYTIGLARTLRKYPGLCAKFELNEKKRPMMQSILTRMYSGDSDAEDIREIMKITRVWQKELPDLFHSDTLTRGLAPYVAVELWDEGKHNEAIRLIAASDLRDTGKRITASLIESLENDADFEALARAGLPEGVISHWLKQLGSLEGEEFNERCRMIERFDELGMLDNQQFSLRGRDLEKVLLELWNAEDSSRLRHWIETCYWMYSDRSFDDLALMAGLLRLTGSEEELLKMSRSPRGKKKPVHRAVLLHMLGLDGDMKLLLKEAGDDYDFEQLLSWHGHHEQAVMREHARRNEGNISTKRTLSRLLEKEQAREEFEAHEIRAEVTGDSWVVSALLGVNLEPHLRKGLEQYGILDMAIRMAEEPLILPALEQRVLKAVAGPVKLQMGVMDNYLEMVRHMKDKEKARGILGRWLELSLKEIEQRGGRKVHELMYRTFVDCGWEKEAKELLIRLDEAGGGLNKMKSNQIYQLGGWACGKSGLNGPGWKLIKLEHPEKNDIDAFYEMSRMCPLDFALADAVSLAELARKHQQNLSIPELREILGRWVSIRYSVRVAKDKGFEEHLEAFLEASRKHGDASEPMYVDLKSRWDRPWRANKDLWKDSVIIQGQKKALKLWQDGRKDEARVLMADLMVRSLLDKSLPAGLELAVSCGKRMDTRDYSPPQLFIRSAEVLDLPRELAGPGLEILCRMHLFSDDYLIESAEKVGLHQLALSMQGMRIGRSVNRTLDSVTDEHVPNLRRLECKVAMDEGDRDGLLEAFPRYVRVDPYQADFMLKVRQWFVDRDDQKGVQAVDQAVIRFFEDRLLLLPGYGRYQGQIDKWRRLTGAQN